MELLGRSAVPLLGMISGWLVAGSASHRTYGAFIGGKTRTILLPMLLWNLLALLIISGGAYAEFLKAPIPVSFQEAFNQLLCLTAPNETNVQMAFLRDLFVCMMLAPLLVRWPERRLILLATMTAVWAIFGLLVPLLLRPAILLFFIAGILARRGGIEMRVASLPFAVTALNETNVQMVFVCGLCGCMFVAPLLVRWPERRLIFVATMTAVWAIFGLLVPLLLRPAILLFFIAGILARRGGIEMRVASLPFAVTAFPFMLLASIKIWLSTIDSGFAASLQPSMAVVDPALRFALALFFWRFSWRA